MRHLPWKAYFFAANDFATSRMQSMTSFATGLRVRLLRVTIATALGGIGNATGSALNGRFLAFNRIIAWEKTVRKRPEAKSMSLSRGERAETVARGGSTPEARKASAINDATSVPVGRSQGSLTRSAS